MSIVLDPAMDPRDHGKEPGTWSNKCKEKRHWVMAVVTAKQQAFLREGLGLSFVLGLHHPTRYAMFPNLHPAVPYWIFSCLKTYFTIIIIDSNNTLNASVRPKTARADEGGAASVQASSMERAKGSFGPSSQRSACL